VTFFDSRRRELLNDVATARTTALALGNGFYLLSDPLLFVIPSEAEGSAVLRTLPGFVFRQGEAEPRFSLRKKKDATPGSGIAPHL
jgi:hypothetical protein